MKKIFSIFAASLMLFAASCSTEKFDEPKGDGNVTFTVQLPAGLQSRAIGDGTTATKLYVAAYEAGTTAPLSVAPGTTPVDMSNLTATVTLQLVTGKTYDLVFWAQAADAPYAFTPNGRTVAMNYGTAPANAENRDAFFYIWNDFTVTGPMNETVTLKRPFAQLNFATSDWDAAVASGLNVATTSVEVKQLLPTLNLDNGLAEGTPVDVTFTDAALPGESITIGGNAYKYLALNYLLMDATRSTVDVKLTAKESASDLRVLEVSSVPVQRNYRTNIYGNLLTSTTTYNVEIEPNFNAPDNDYMVWDGRTVETPTVVNNVVTITKPSQWAALRNVAGIENYTVELAADLDFGNQILKGQICPKEFDGKGYTMKNMILAHGDSDYSIGLFQGDASLSSISKTIKNVTIENVKIDCTNPDQGYAGVLFGDIQSQDLSIEGVTVKNADVKGVCADGALVGFVASGKTISINNCTVANSRIYNYAVDKESGFVGGLVGRVVGTAEGSNNALTDVTIDGFYAARRGSASVDAVAGVSGSSTLTATETNVTVNKKCLIGPACANDDMKNALTEDIENLNVYLAGDVTVAFSSTSFLYGGDNTSVVTFNGNGHKLTIDSSYRQWMKAKNANAKLVLNDLTLDGTFASETTWDGYDIIFMNEVEANGVTFGRAVAVDRVKATFNNSIINQEFSADAYALWIVAGSDVTVNGCAINSKTGHGGRAIKVADQYTCDTHNGGGTPAATTLSVTGTTFKSDKKAAILVSSCSNTNITWGAGNDISEVTADSTNPVWKDSDSSFIGTIITTNGCSYISEP